MGPTDAAIFRLGETGIRTAESKKKMREDKKARANEIAELNAKLEAMTAERDVLKEGAKSRAKMDNKVEELQKEIDKKAGDDGKKKPYVFLTLLALISPYPDLNVSRIMGR